MPSSSGASIRFGTIATVTVAPTSVPAHDYFASETVFA
jgi:hypothetical protein